MSSKFENKAKVVGGINSVNFDGEAGSGLAKIGITGNKSSLYLNMWEKTDDDDNPLGVVKRFCKGLEKGNKYEVQGELNERMWDGEFRRDLLNKMISDDKVYGVKEVDENAKELAIVKLSGDVIERDMEFTKEVKGRTVDENVAKYMVTLAVYSQFNPRTGNEDLTRHEVLTNEIKSHRDYLKRNNQNPSKQYDNWINKLENGADMETLFDILDSFRDERDSMFNIDIIHLVSYGEKAETLKEKTDIGDNITVGCDINTQAVVNDYGIVEGNLNEVEMQSFGGVNETVMESTGGAEDKHKW